MPPRDDAELDFGRARCNSGDYGPLVMRQMCLVVSAGEGVRQEIQSEISDGVVGPYDRGTCNIGVGARVLTAPGRRAR